MTTIEKKTPFTFLMAAGLWAAFSAIYRFTSSYQFSYDGICYALDVEVGPTSNLFHPNHLFYSSIGRLLFSVASTLHWAYRSLPVLVFANAIVGGFAVAVLFVLLRPRVGTLVAVGGAALFGFSAAFWIEATDPGCYAWAGAASCLLLALYVNENTKALKIGMTHGLLIGWHQMLALVAPAFLLRYVRTSSYRNGGAYLIGLLGVAGAIYLSAAVVFHGSSAREMMDWTFGPAGARPGSEIFHQSWWSTKWRMNIVAFWSGFRQAWLYEVPGVPALRWLSHGVALAIAVTLLRGLVRQSKSAGLAGLWVWILMLATFEFFWNPGVTRFRILFQPAVIYLLADGVANNRRWRGPAAVLIGLIACCNFIYLAMPRHDPRNSPDFLRAMWLSQRIAPEDRFLFSGSGSGSVVNVYVRYFAPNVPARSVMGFLFAHPSAAPADLAALTAYAGQGKHLFIEASLYEPSTQATLESYGRLPAGTIQRWLASLPPGRSYKAPDGYTIIESVRSSDPRVSPRAFPKRALRPLPFRPSTTATSLP